MPEQPTATLHLLVVHPTQKEAESVLKPLREAGLVIHSHFIASQAELSQQLAQQNWDLLLYKFNTESLTAEQALTLIHQAKADTTMLVLIDQLEPSVHQAVVKLGIRDVILAKDSKHLLTAVTQAHRALLAQRHEQQWRHRAEEAEQRCQLLMDSSTDAIAYVHGGMHIAANTNYQMLFNLEDIDELQATPIMDLFAPDDISKLKTALKINTSQEPIDFKIKDGKGNVLTAQLLFSHTHYQGEPCNQIVVRQSSAKESTSTLQEKVRQLSAQDHATGLFNRKYFSAALESAYRKIANGKGQQWILHLGITNMETIKVQAGIAGTDDVLQELARLYQPYQPKNSVLARYGYDSFALLIYGNEDLKDIQKQALTARQHIQKHLFEGGGKTIQVEITFGLAILDKACRNGHEGLAHAYQAYSEALSEGKPFGQYASAKIDAVSNDSMVSSIKQALAKDQFRLLFQPIMSLKRDTRSLYHALLRLLDKQGNEISPDRFLPMVESGNLGKELDRWVLTNTIKTLVAHRAEGHNTQIFVHVTAASIQDPTFLPWVNSVLKVQRLPGQALCFQISEGEALRHLKVAKAFSNGLALLKCQLTLTNFGVEPQGSNLFNHLKVHYVRVSTHFIDQINQDEKHLQELADLVRQIHTNGSRSIIPHIENAEILASLWELGVHYIQGFYVQPPQSTMDYDFNNEN